MEVFDGMDGTSDEWRGRIEVNVADKNKVIWEEREDMWILGCRYDFGFRVSRFSVNMSM